MSIVSETIQLKTRTIGTAGASPRDRKHLGRRLSRDLSRTDFYGIPGSGLIRIAPVANTSSPLQNSDANSRIEETHEGHTGEDAEHISDLRYAYDSDTRRVSSEVSTTEDKANDSRKRKHSSGETRSRHSSKHIASVEGDDGAEPATTVRKASLVPGTTPDRKLSVVSDKAKDLKLLAVSSALTERKLSVASGVATDQKSSQVSGSGLGTGSSAVLEKLRSRRKSDAAPKQVKRLSDLFKGGGGGGVGAVSKWKHRMKMTKNKIPPLQRFRNYQRLALICIRLCRNSLENVKAHSSEYLSIIQLTQDYVNPLSDHGGLFFDPTLYRANKEKRFPADARKVLQKYQTFRTEKELNYAHLVLRNSIQAFSEYPSKMQEALVKVAWYEAYEPKRAIVRQGQSPLAFYIILSGSVIVTSYDRKSETTTFLVALHRGMSFGELAVINHSQRQATVSTATITELLCISAKDFVEIFMSGGIKGMLTSDQDSFIRSIPFLKHWPIECLQSNPQACMFHFFGRGQVIVRDSLHSDWIYIVKSGSLSVLKKLTEVRPRKNRRSTSSDTEDDEDSDDDTSSSRSFGTWNFKIKKKKRRDSLLEKEVFKNNIEAEKRLEQTLPGYFNAGDRLSIIDYESIINDHKSRVLQTGKRALNPDGATQLPKIPTTTESSIAENSDEATSRSNVEQVEEEKMEKLPKIRKTSKHVLWSDPEVKPVTKINRNVPPAPKFSPKGAYLATMKPSRRKTSRKEAIQEELFQKQLEYDKTLLEDRKFGRKTMADDFDNKLIKNFTLTEKDIRPMFVLVQVLEKGQHFGLTKSVFPEQAESFSVVSNGAECIMISKKFFLEKSTEQTMLHLRKVETLLPPEEELQTGLQDFVDWRAHRAKVYNRLVRNKTDRTARQSQYPQQIHGQYNFRSGPIVRLSSDF